MATDLSFVPGRNAGSENPILNGFRFILNRKKNESSYWKVPLFRTGSSARITTVDKQLVSPVPVHSHEVQHAEKTVHIAKQILKRKAAETDFPTKYLAAETVAGMRFEARSKLGCQIYGWRLPASVHSARLRDSYPQRSFRSLPFLYTSRLLLPLQESPLQTSTEVRSDGGVPLPGQVSK